MQFSPWIEMLELKLPTATMVYEEEGGKVGLMYGNIVLHALTCT